MSNIFEEKRPHMLKMVKAGGQEIIDRAEEIIGTDGLVSSIKLTLSFDETMGFPELEICRTHLCHNALKALDEVKRRTEKVITSNQNYSLGDQLSIGKYIATCVKVETNDLLNYTEYTFCFDTYIDEQMNQNEMLSKLDDWFWSYPGFNSIRVNVCFDRAPDGRITHLRVPYVGEMFGSEEERQDYIPDNPNGTWKDQWECMKDIRKRAGIRSNGVSDYGWLMNAFQEMDGSPSKVAFASVDCRGSATPVVASYVHGIRPVFTIRILDMTK